jgi:hypothetical protein
MTAHRVRGAIAGHGLGLLTASTPFAYPQAIGCRLACFHAANPDIVAAQVGVVPIRRTTRGARWRTFVQPS